MRDAMSEPELRVLVVDDESAIRRFLRVALNTHGYKVFEAGAARDALAMIVDDRPDLVILDLGLPDLDGVEVTRRIREWSSTPIIILSVREAETEKIAALDAGADDYLTKPFGLGELLARMRVVMRHQPTVTAEPVIRSGDLTVDLARRSVKVGDNEVSLTATEYALLRALAAHAGRVLTHSQLLRQVWGPGYESELHMLRVNLSNLRHKIEPDSTRPIYIQTEPGVGYRLRLPD
jgi:two-component system, OmpR family, KDP operon response regulator KdpE